MFMKSNPIKLPLQADKRVSRPTLKCSELKISGKSEPKTLGLSEMADNVRLMDSVRKLRLEGAGL
jgi:hypothetical protein